MKIPNGDKFYKGYIIFFVLLIIDFPAIWSIFPIAGGIAQSFFGEYDNSWYFIDGDIVFAFLASTILFIMHLFIYAVLKVFINKRLYYYVILPFFIGMILCVIWYISDIANHVWLDFSSWFLSVYFIALLEALVVAWAFHIIRKD